jgi:cation diffusion facilitator CzcD-associated flavoprotein CzcO
MHSATWDNSYDLSGKTVAILGGGSSAVQIIPNIQPGKPTDAVLNFTDTLGTNSI